MFSYIIDANIIFNSARKTTNSTDYVLKDLRMGRFGNIFQKIRSKVPSTEFTKHKHEDCTNFDNGRCKAAPRIFRGQLTDLPPKGPACIHFKARIAES